MHVDIHAWLQYHKLQCYKCPLLSRCLFKLCLLMLTNVVVVMADYSMKMCTSICSKCHIYTYIKACNLSVHSNNIASVLTNYAQVMLILHLDLRVPMCSLAVYIHALFYNFAFVNNFNSWHTDNHVHMHFAVCVK